MNAYVCELNYAFGVLGAAMELWVVVSESGTRGGVIFFRFMISCFLASFLLVSFSCSSGYLGDIFSKIW